MLRIEEVLRLEFNSIDMIPGERKHVQCCQIVPWDYIVQ